MNGLKMVTFKTRFNVSDKLGNIVPLAFLEYALDVRRHFFTVTEAMLAKILLHKVICRYDY